MLTLPMTPKNRNNEWQKILTIAKRNNFPIQLMSKLRNKIQDRQNSSKTERSDKKWTTFTHFSPKIRKLTNIFQKTNLNITYRATNTIAKKTKRTTQPENDKTDSRQDYKKSGIYTITCITCNQEYIGQTNKNIAIRHSEHIRYIRNNYPQSAYAEHILKNRHEYGNLNNTMKLIKHINIASKLIPYEQMTIQQAHHKGTLIPEQKCYEHNPLYKLANTVDIT
jgi:hypothetical protein